MKAKEGAANDEEDPPGHTVDVMASLIINADDLGLDAKTTDAILGCFRAHRITSASAMVWMSDSQRAAQIALEADMPVRLHLNLTAPFTDSSVPPEVRRRQALLCEHFEAQPIAYWICHPRHQAAIARCIEDQVRAFTQLYGRQPVDVDGHQHIHTCLNILLSRSIGVAVTMRSTFTFKPSEKGIVNRGFRRVINELLWRRFTSTRRFVSIRAPDTDIGLLDQGALEAKLAWSLGSTLEVMTHPGLCDEYEFLMSEEWLRLIADKPLGSFRDLRGPRRQPLRSAPCFG